MSKLNEAERNTGPVRSTGPILSMKGLALYVYCRDSNCGDKMVARPGLGVPLVGLSLVWRIAWRLFIAKAMFKQILIHQEHFTDLIHQEHFTDPMPQLGGEFSEGQNTNTRTKVSVPVKATVPWLVNFLGPHLKLISMLFWWVWWENPKSDTC